MSPFLFRCKFMLVILLIYSYYLKAKGLDIVLVNPMHVKKSKELDDNSPTKNDTKDAKVIAQLVKDGRYSVPNLLDGVYAELREGIKIRDQLIQQMMTIEGRIQNVIQRYFPEFFDVFGDWKGKAALCTLRTFPFPADIKEKTPEDIVSTWRKVVQRGVGLKRAQQLVDRAQRSIGLQVGLKLAKRELQYLLEQYELYQKQIEDLDVELETLVTIQPHHKVS